MKAKVAVAHHGQDVALSDVAVVGRKYALKTTALNLLMFGDW